MGDTFVSIGSGSVDVGWTPMRIRSTGAYAWEMCTMTAEPVRQSSPDEVARLRDCVNELVAANERLTKEVAELRQTEQVLHANELNFQLTVDSMPGMVHTMTATG